MKQLWVQWVSNHLNRTSDFLSSSVDRISDWVKDDSCMLWDGCGLIVSTSFHNNPKVSYTIRTPTMYYTMNGFTFEYTLPSFIWVLNWTSDGRIDSNALILWSESFENINRI